MSDFIDDTFPVPVDNGYRGPRIPHVSDLMTSLLNRRHGKRKPFIFTLDMMEPRPYYDPLCMPEESSASARANQAAIDKRARKAAKVMKGAAHE